MSPVAVDGREHNAAKCRRESSHIEISPASMKTRSTIRSDLAEPPGRVANLTTRKNRVAFML
jgi:hypothetical protein